MRIRAFVDADYASVTRLHNLTYGDFAKNVDEIRFRDAHFPEEWCWKRWSAVDESDNVVGFAEYHHILGMTDPHRFNLDIGVDRSASGRGVGSALYATVLEALAPSEPISLATWARGDMPCLSGFLLRRGFVADTEMYTSGLDLSAFDPNAWEQKVAYLRKQGLVLRSLADLGVGDLSVRRELYDLWCEVRQDMPIPAGETRSEVAPFDDFCAQQFDHPALFPEGFFVAVDGDRFVGTSQFFSSPVEGELRTGLTGVRRAYRRRGIAFGLKAHALRFAYDRGYKRVITDNAAVNLGMLAINVAMGFQRNPVWTRYLKTF